MDGKLVLKVIIKSTLVSLQPQVDNRQELSGLSEEGRGAKLNERLGESTNLIATPYGSDEDLCIKYVGFLAIITRDFGPGGRAHGRTMSQQIRLEPCVNG
jgi:hypothetical protein